MPRPPRAVLEGRFVRLEPLRAEMHAAPLFDAFAEDVEGRCWTYLPDGPFTEMDAFADWAVGAEQSEDPQFYALVAEERPVGFASYLRINPEAATIEVGFINFSPALQRRPAATEAMALMMHQAFALGYRRYEWKCDALNEPSRRAAARLGFTYEGIHRQATHYKGRNRDTAWFSILDSEWPAVRDGFADWLSPKNFDKAGQQRRGLEACRP